MKRFIIYKILILSILIIFPLCANASKETLIIVDQSASMYEPFINNLKFFYVQNAVTKVLNSMSDNDYIGLRTIGMNPDRLRMRGRVDNFSLCTATERLNDIAQNNRDNIQMSMYRIIPSGPSPIEFVLHTAINQDFSANADQKEIILITDGYENCNGNPCNYIRRLMLTRRDIKINIISIGASDEDIMGLKCLSDTTGGNFKNVSTPYSLESSLQEILSNINYSNQNMQANQPQQHQSSPQTVTNKIILKNYLMEFNQ